MGIIGIGSYNGSSMYYVQKTKMNSKQVQGFNSASTVINLHMGDENSEDKALTSVGFPDGSSYSVFHGDGNGQYRVKRWDGKEDAKEYNVNAYNVRADDANYLEMLALSTHLDVTGQTKNAFGDFISAAGGVNGDLSFGINGFDQKYNFKSLIAEFMQGQYNAGNLTGYMSVKSLYDHL